MLIALVSCTKDFESTNQNPNQIIVVKKNEKSRNKKTKSNVILIFKKSIKNQVCQLI